MWANGEPVDRADIALREAWRGPVTQVDAVLVEEEDRGQHPVRVGLDHEGQRLEDPGERDVAADHLQHADLPGRQPFGALALGNIQQRAQHRRRAGPRDERGHDFHPDPRAVFARPFTLVAERSRLPAQPGGVIALQTGPFMKRERVPEVETDQVLRALEPEHRGQRGVGEQDNELAVEADPLDRSLRQSSVPGLTVPQGRLDHFECCGAPRERRRTGAERVEFGAGRRPGLA